MSDGDAAVRYAALGAVAALAAPAEQGVAPAPAVDTVAIAKLADDPDSHVRSKVAQALAAVSRGRPQPPAELMATVEKLLNDPSPAVQVGTIHALWGWPLSEKGERRLIELSRDPVVGYPAIYYALSTLPTKSRPVAERLIEVMQAKGAAADRNSTGRAAWGLSHFPIADDAKELVIDAFIKDLDESTDGSVRREAVYGLGRLGGDKAIAKLEALAKEEEAQQLRREAADAVRQLKG
jgi:HEAT repeat protein